MKFISFLISVIFYFIGVAGLFYCILWMGNLLPFDTIEGTRIKMSPTVALLKNAGLILIFGLQHSIMARQGFKKAWTSIVPSHLERSIYVFISGLLCLLISWQWEAIDGFLWSFESGTALYYLSYGVFFFGIVFLLASTFLVNHFELFGVQQTFFHMRNKEAADPVFKDHFFYKFVRHPIYLGFTMILIGTPHMSMTHFSLFVGFFIYILVGIYFEEKDLVRMFGNTYVEYKKRVSRLIPFLPI